MKYTFSFLIIIFVMLYGCSNEGKLVNSNDGALSTFSWSTLDTKGESTARHECSMVECNGKFYLIGGRGVNPVDVFDPATNTWQAFGETPLEIHHFQAVNYKDTIFLIGAMTGEYPEEKLLENIYKYHPGEDRWEKGAEIPLAFRRGSSGAVLYEDKIYLVGGIDLGHTSGTNNLFSSYNLSTGEWTELTKAPHIRDHFSAIVVEDKLYCIGGRNTSFHLPEDFEAFFEATVPYVDVYDFKEKQWKTLEAQLPYPTAAGGTVILEDNIIYFGGEGTLDHAYDQTQCLNTKTLEWTLLSPLKTGRHGGGAVVYDNKIFTAAGSPNKGGGDLSSIEVFSVKK